MMLQKKEATLGFNCPYCGYQYKFAGLSLMDKRVKCGSCNSKFSVRSAMSTVSMSLPRRRDTVHNM
jgi:transposase-like protein